MEDRTARHEEVERRARRRHGATLIAIVVLVPIVMLVLDSTILRGSDETSHGHHSHGGWAVAIGTSIAIVVAGGVAALLIRRGRRKPGSLFAAPMVAGLPRRQRRSVRRNIRRGTPSSDPTQAQVERETATQMVQTSRRTIVLFVLFFVLDVVELFVSKTTGTRILFAAGAVLFGAMLVLSLTQVRGARVYLGEAAGTTRQQ